MTTATPNNVTITKDGIKVTIGTIMAEENYTKVLKAITTPKTTQNQDIEEGANTPRILDILNKPENRITIDGYIQTGLGSSDTHSYANEKRDDLRKIFFGGGTFTLNFEGTDYSTNSDKFSIKWVTDDVSPVEQYSVKFTVIVGEDLT